MTQFYSILTTEANAGNDFLQFLPFILLGLCGVILVVAFIVGYKRGVRRVSWAGLVWLVTALAFCLLHGLIGEAIAGALQTPISNMTAGLPFEAESITKVTDALVSFLPTFIIALACILLVMVGYGLCSHAFRPRIKMIPKTADAYTMDEDGVEYDEDHEDYDDYESYTTRKMPMRINCQTPAFGGRLLGGLMCFINAFMVIATTLILALFMLNATPLKYGSLAFLFEFEIGGFVPVPALLTFAHRYALDIFFIGILIAFICKGRRNGFVETLRSLMKFVGLFAVLFSFYLPFSALAKEGGSYFLWAFTERCVKAMQNIFGEGSMAWLAPIVGKLLTGLLSALFLVAVFVFVNWVLRKLGEFTIKHPVARVMDGIFSGLIYLIVGIIVCFLVWAVWYLLTRYGIFNVTEIFSEEATLSNGLFNVLEAFIEPLLVKIDQALGIL